MTARNDELLRSIAHDMRSPLAVIKGFADALLDGSIPEEKRELSLTLISLEADRLSRLASRLCEDGIPKISTFDICDVTRRIFLTLEPKFLQKSLHTSFTFDDDDAVYVSADPDMIYEVIYNLADNAQKYTPHGGNIAFSVSKADSGMIFSITNSIDSDIAHQERLFAEGYRDTNSMGTKGTGLGLYITKKLLSAHGKDISLNINDGNVTFAFSLDSED